MSCTCSEPKVPHCYTHNDDNNNKNKYNNKYKSKYNSKCKKHVSAAATTTRALHGMTYLAVERSPNNRINPSGSKM
jgi:hypothetical protein